MKALVTLLLCQQIMCNLQGQGEGWHYRTRIGPRPDLKCWYLGPRMIPRARLYWAETPAIAPMEVERPPWAKPEGTQ